MPVAKGEPLDPAATRERILDTASRVFYEKGTLAVGVNELAAEAGVSKVTLYRHFDSKEALVAAFLRRRSDRVSAWLREVSDGLEPRDRVLALFDALGEWFKEPAFNGCALVNGAIEARGAQSAGPGDRRRASRPPSRPPRRTRGGARPAAARPRRGRDDRRVRPQRPGRGAGRRTAAEALLEQAARRP